MMHPFQPFSQLSKLHDDMLRSFESQGGRSATKTTAATWAPPVDVIDEGERLSFAVDVPGVPKDAISIKVEKRVLTIEGERKLVLSEKNDHVRLERAHGPFSRSFRLPDSVDADAISAELRDGVLHVTLPQKKDALSKKVDIK